MSMVRVRGRPRSIEIDSGNVNITSKRLFADMIVTQVFQSICSKTRSVTKTATIRVPIGFRCEAWHIYVWGNCEGLTYRLYFALSAGPKGPKPTVPP